MKNLSILVFLVLFLCTACSTKTTSMQPSPSVVDTPLDTPSVTYLNTPSETFSPTEPVYIPVQEMFDVTTLDVDTLDLSHLSDDERELVGILLNYMTAYLDNDLKSIEPYLDDSFILDIPSINHNISKIILKWNIGENSPEKTVMVFEFHFSDYDSYLYNDVYLRKTSGEWKIYDSPFQP